MSKTYEEPVVYFSAADPMDHSMVTEFNDDYLISEYSAVYRRWEEVITRRIYYMDGVADERVAATLHSLVNKDQDEQIITELQTSQFAVNLIANPPQVVELPFTMIEIEKQGPSITAALVIKVLRAISAAIGSLDSRHDGDPSNHPTDTTAMQFVDSLIDIPSRRINPLDFNAGSLASHCLSAESLVLLANALNLSNITSSEPGQGSDNAQVGGKCIGIYPVEEVLEIHQYYYLLRMFGDSDIVRSKIQNFFAEEGSRLRHSRNEDDLNVSRLCYHGIVSMLSHPIIGMVMTLRDLQKRVDSTINDSNSNIYDAIHASLKLRSEALEAKRKEDIRKSLQLLSRALENPSIDENESKSQRKPKKSKTNQYNFPDDSASDLEDDDDDRESAEDRDNLDPFNATDDDAKKLINGRLLLPVYLQVELLCEMAEGRVEAIERGHEEEVTEAINLVFSNCNEAIKLDPKAEKAYFCRSKAFTLMSEVYNGEYPEEDDMDNPIDSSLDVDNLSLLIQSSAENKVSIDILRIAAAKDMLKAFVLGGSDDLKLASSAEDAVREACRNKARNVYKRRSSRFLNSVDVKSSEISFDECDDEWTMPKEWMIKAFFGGYELLSDALNVLPIVLEEQVDKSLVLTYDNILNSSDTIQKIVDDMTMIDLSASLPPSHLLEHRSSQFEVTNITEDDDIHSSRTDSSLPQVVGDKVILAEDRWAYYLLRQLIELLDSFVDHSMAKTSILSENSTNLGFKLNVNDSEELIDNLKWRVDSKEQNSLRLLSEGIADTDTAIHADVVSNPQKHNSINPVELALNLLRSERASAITGVIFHPVKGSIHSVNPSAKEEQEYDDDMIDNESDEPDNNYSNRCVSRYLRSRLLNIIASIAYISGDAVGAIKCLRVGINEDTKLQDNYLKLATLLIDMDEVEEANRIFLKLQRNAGNPFVLIHNAELYIHLSEFNEALNLLVKADDILRQSLSTGLSLQTSSYRLASELIAKDGFKASIEKQLSIEKRRKQALLRLLGNISCLRGVTLFRTDPTSPERAVHYIKQSQQLIAEQERGISTNLDDPDVDCANIFLTMCLGELLSQSGDVISALNLYAKASSREPNHPLPFANAARAYQQLQQSAMAEKHLLRALELDPNLSMTWVDYAQSKSLNGDPRSALEALKKALNLARHVSEIRDVITAQTVTEILLEFQNKGIYSPPLKEFPLRIE